MSKRALCRWKTLLFYWSFVCFLFCKLKLAGQQQTKKPGKKSINSVSFFFGPLALNLATFGTTKFLFLSSWRVGRPPAKVAPLRKCPFFSICVQPHASCCCCWCCFVSCRRFRLNWFGWNLLYSIFSRLALYKCQCGDNSIWKNI